MFRNFALVMLALAATALWTASSDARGRGCHGGGRHSHGHCGGGGCGSCGAAPSCGSCAAPACASCEAPACATCAAPACATGDCPGGRCAVAAPTVAVARTTAPSYLVVSLPAGARLSIDDQPTTSTSATRTFVTPELHPHYVYTYTLKAEMVRDGKVETVSQKVQVTAGKELKVDLTAVPAESVAAK